ncbi:MAG: phosphoribosylaminoimidazolesuccinocarboxamide synthase [Anaerolineae bacterium]
MGEREFQFGPKLAEGKTKVIYAHPGDPALVYMTHKDNLSAGDGARRNVLPGKGAAACETTSNVFEVLNGAGIATHYVDKVGDVVNIVRRCEMIPLEVVMRRVATGSYIRRHPEVEEGTRFDPVLVEFFYKDDEAHDPLVTDKQIAEMDVATPAEIEAMRSVGREVFEVLEAKWAEQDVVLVDCKIEFGRTDEGALLVADVIDNDSWRIWPGGDRSRMLDKQVYREMPEVTDERLADLLTKYLQVAELTSEWVD